LEHLSNKLGSLFHTPLAFDASINVVHLSHDR
jgi:hypothetical protein